MSALQLVAIVLSLVVSTIGWVMLFRTVYGYVRLFRVGAPDPTRTNQPGKRTVTLLREFLGHTRMARLPLVAIAHWITAVGFLVLFTTLITAFGQLFKADFALPLIGHFPPFEWLVEVLAWTMLVAIVYLMVLRQARHPRATKPPRRSRFYGSNWWQAYYVEFTILGVGLCILALRSLEAALAPFADPQMSVALHFPLTGWTAGLWSGLGEEGIRQAIYLFAFLKIMISFAWMITVSLTPTMGVAWHRFLAFFNIWFKRNADGRTALGPLRPMVVDGEPVTAANLEDVMEKMAEAEDEDAEVAMGVGKIDQFSWKGLLDFTTCTECGRCQSQCPAWNTDKPLSPKMLMITLRNHAYEQAPYLLATEAERAALPEHQRQLANVGLVGSTNYTLDHPLTAYDHLGPEAIIDEDVLWSCTTCGACVEQCPVDIEHVDAIVDMRRHKVLIDSAFPAELGGLFKNMESRQNPWGMASKLRLDWAKGLDFDVPVVGSDVESLDEVDYLFWVGCAGAYEDRAKKTSRAVAELLHTAGVSFAILGEGEACTGDSARRAGNEILFQMLAAQNIETLNEAGAKKIVVTCAHCFNTIRNEYPQAGGNYEVVHHTQLLNRLVREKKLVPVARPGQASAQDVASTAPSVTYHDPCYLGRHNNVYAPPRELLGALPGVQLKEMPRSGEKSFCCGAGGARMWMEEKLGTRINEDRTAEAVGTGADRIAIGCPFCRVMLSDGLTAAQASGKARAEVEVVDVAQMLLAAVRAPEGAPPVEAGSAAPEVAGGSAATAALPVDRAEVSVPGGGLNSNAEVDHIPQPAPSASERAEARADTPQPSGAGSTAAHASDAVTAMRAHTPETEEAPAASEEAGAGSSQAVSASDALAAMRAQAAGGEDPGSVTPSGGGSTAAHASDAVTAMRGHSPEPDGASTGAPPAGGPVSASDALAAMRAQQAGQGTSAPSTVSDPAADAASDAAPSGKEPAATVAADKPAPEKPAPGKPVSATDALAALRAQSAATDPAPAASAPPAAEPASETASEPAAARPTQAPAAPPAATPAPAASSGKAPSIPTGKMSATEALALLRGQSGAPAPGAASAPSTAAPSAPAQPEASSVESARTATEPAAEPTAAAEPTPVQAVQADEPQPAAKPAATTAPTPPTAPAAVSAPAKPAAKPTIPSGRMTATEALALLRGQAQAGDAAEPAPTQPSEPAAATSTSAQPSPAETAPTETPAADTAAADTAAGDDTVGDPGAAQEPAAQTAAPAAPAPAAAKPSAAPAPSPAHPSGHPSAAEAFAKFRGDAGGGPPVATAPPADSALTAAPGPPASEPAATPDPQASAGETARADEPTEPSPAEQPATPEPAATPAPAPAQSSTTPAGGRADAAAWQRLVDAADGKTLPASEALKILRGE